MKLTIVLASCVLLSTGCVTVKAPDNLVSDSVKAGKDIYHTVKDEFKTKEENKAATYTVSYEAPANESYSDSNNKCIEAAIEKAKKETNTYHLEIVKTESNVITQDNTKVYSCSVSI